MNQYNIPSEIPLRDLGRVETTYQWPLPTLPLPQGGNSGSISQQADAQVVLSNLHYTLIVELGPYIDKQHEASRAILEVSKSIRRL